MDFMWRYQGSKGVPERKVEDGVWGNLAPPGDLEESASHQIRENNQDASRYFGNALYGHYMMWGCYRSHPGVIMGTSIFRDFHGHDPKVEMFQGFRSSASNGVDTIGKSVKNYGDSCRD